MKIDTIVSIKRARDLLIEELKGKDLFILVYNAFSSKSVYIKFDYGVAHTLRISDHRGKGYYYYFNIRTDS